MSVPVSTYMKKEEEEEEEEEEPIRVGWRKIGWEQSEKTLDYTCVYINVIAGVLIVTIVIFFFQENKSHSVEPFALILCLHTCWKSRAEH